MHIPSLVIDLAMMLLAAGIVSVIFRKIHLPVILGYIAVGFLISPYFPMFFNVEDVPAIDTLSEIGVLESFGQWLEHATDGNAYLVTGIIGAASSIVDNVPLVAGCIGMYDVATPAAVAANPEMIMFVQDGTFWELLAYCAGVGGSMLIIGSAAGVVVMGLENISFGWYLRRVTVYALLGYLAGILTYALL